MLTTERINIMPRKTSKHNDYDLLIQAIGLEVAKDFTDSEMKILEHTLYEGLVTRSINELRSLRTKLISLPEYKKKYLENKLKIVPVIEKEVEKVEPVVEEYGSYTA
jgi:hypothetical protein